MKLMVDIKKAVQEYDLDAGTAKNFLVFTLGGKEHKVEASDEQLQQAIYEARVASHTQPQASASSSVPAQQPTASHPEPGPLSRHLASIEPEEEPEEELSVEDVGAQLLAEGLSENEVLSILVQNFPEHFHGGGLGGSDDNAPPTLFEDFSGQPTSEEMAEFVSEKDQMPDQINVSSDDISEGGTLEGIIAGPHRDPDDVVHRHPRTGQILSEGQYQRIARHMKKPHIAVSQSDAAKKAALRARAARIPKRSVQADDAGNPVTPQTAAPQPVVQTRPGPPMPGFDDDGFSQG